MGQSKEALKGEYEECVRDHLFATTSALFEAGEQRQIAVKVIDDGLEWNGDTGLSDEVRPL